MLEKLKGLSQKYAEIEYMLSQSEVWADAQKAAALSREKAELAPLMEAYARYEAFRQEAESAEELLSDPEMKDLARETLSEARSGMERTAEELKILLLPKDPDDGKNVIVEIRGGVGGEESALFAADLFRMYEMYAERKGFSVEIVNRSETELGGIREIDFIVGGTNAFSRFRFESGVHRVQRVPETETQGRIHTSTCTVAVLPELEEAKMPAAIYGRLSVEDEEKEESMETQIALVQDYINRSRELSYVDTYFDNGFTGTNFKRPAFTRLMNDVRQKKIKCIVVKDDCVIIEPTQKDLENQGFVAGSICF